MTEKDLTPPREASRSAALVELVAVVLVLVCPGLYAWVARTEFPPLTTGLLIVITSQAAGMTLLVASLLRQQRDVPWPLYKPARGWIFECVVAALLTVFVSLVYRFVWYLTPALATTDDPSRFPDAPAGDVSAVMLLLYNVLAVIYEEVVSRAYLVTRIARHLRLGSAASVVIAAAIFAIAHGYGSRGTVLTFAVGIVFGAAYVKTRSLPCIVLAHCALNVLLESMSH